MKNFLYILTILSTLASCSSSRRAAAVSEATSGGSRSGSEPRFLENITINTVDHSRSEETEIRKPRRIRPVADVPGAVYSSETERCLALQFKYAILMEEPVEAVTNDRLIDFLEEWYGTPYQFGGDSKKGIDCSAFCGLMMNMVYGISLPRTAREQYRVGRKVAKTNLLQGDLVFFNTTGGVSHVGVFLGNNKFVHAGSSNGVMISDLTDAYFKRRYIGATRPR